MDTRRTRRTALLGALLCTVLFAVLTVLVATEWGPLLDLDRDLGDWPFRFTSEHGPVERTAEIIAAVTQPNWVMVAGAVAGVALVVKGYRRAAVFAVLVLSVARVG